MVNLVLETESSLCQLSYLGSGVVYETMWDKDNGVQVNAVPHYLENARTAQEFMIRNAYALLSAGWRITQ